MWVHVAAARRFTGSHEIGSDDPDAMPSTIWLNDTTPTINTDQWRLTVADNDGRYQLTLATDVGGQSLSRRHGYPLRLVAPNRRGYWWVKWVDRIELRATPLWWQPPFPLALRDVVHDQPDPLRRQASAR